MKDLKETIINDLRNGTSTSFADFLKSDRKKLFFGSGAQACLCYSFCKHVGISVEAFLGSQVSIRGTFLPEDIPFYLVGQFMGAVEEYDVLIAANQKHNSEIKELLRKSGFEHIFFSDNWDETNREYRHSFLNTFLKNEMGEAYHADDDILEWNGFKIWNAIHQPEEYKSMFEGEFFDIIAPAIFGNNQYTYEGTYERVFPEGKVSIEKTDIVLDLGANIGMFSCVAALKGKEVYAFEPTPRVKKLLDQQKKLYSNIHAQEYAVSNKVGTCKFFVNTINQFATGVNTLLENRLTCPGVEEIEVNTTTIDAFVKEHGLKSVDFIKADIEGAERYMLEGAKETLAKFAPKLSLCAYHLPDDPEVLEELILKYNHNYVIKQGEYKLWAYVPKRK